ncbi:MAG: hypothetical protein MUO54_11360 [Anaerolineales bacterium]|nr:hypothetical protein [Anaerolineales bacterium]
MRDAESYGLLIFAKPPDLLVIYSLNHYNGFLAAGFHRAEYPDWLEGFPDSMEEAAQFFSDPENAKMFS